MARWAIYVLLLFCAIVGSARAQQQGPVIVLMEPARHDIAAGESITLKVFVTNNSVAIPAITLTATASFIGDGGTPQVATSTLDLNVSTTVHVGQIMLTIPQPLAYVPNTAVSDGKLLSATASGESLTVVLDQDLAEQYSMLLTIDVIRTQ